MPKDAHTGTAKKSIKSEHKFIRRVNRANTSAAELAGKEREALLNNKENFAIDIPTLARQHQEASQYAMQASSPLREKAISDYQQYGQASAHSQSGGRDVGQSSAVLQAMNASAQNLARDLNADYAGLTDQFLNRRDQNLGGRLNQYNQQLNPGNMAQSGLLQQPTYLQKSGNPSFGKQLLGQGINAAAQGVGYAAGGPVGGMAAGQAAQAYTNSRGWTSGQGADYGSFLKEKFPGSTPTTA